ncbi:N-acetyltransferase family protein [Aquipuribacter sp. MA13-6]|uniref:GNAT family N-acetyltransferase n=1 Tax=unclassified Aquipuribacter TaxID=2635084 RepID=UPI003EEF1874
MSSPLLGAPGADNSVRPAREPDLNAVGAVHAASWTGPYAQVLPAPLVAALTPAVLAEAWRPAVATPPSRRHRVHVAIGDGIVAGFVASAPTPAAETGEAPPDAPANVVEIVALEVDPLHQRRGHGSRLLAAVVDTSRADGVDEVQVWVHVDDAARAGFFRGAGFETDGARRRRAVQGGDPHDARSVWPEVRLVASLAGDDAPDGIAHGAGSDAP